MAKAIHMASFSSGVNTTANTTQYWNHIGGIIPTTTEANANHTMWQAGTYNKLRVGLGGNSIAATSTIRTRKNTANGGSTVSITASTSGNFIDASGSDTIAANDLICIQSVPGAATGALTPRYFVQDFDATTNTVTKLAYSTAATNAATSFASPTTNYYGPLHSQMLNTGTAITTEADAQQAMPEAGTLKNLAVKVTANGRPTAQTLRLRKNGANANSTVSILGAGTGVIRDSTNTDTVALNDKCNYNYVSSSESTAFVTTLAWWAIDFENTSSQSICLQGGFNSTVNTQGKSTTNFYEIAGRIVTGVSSATAGEASTQMRMSTSLTFYNLGILLTTNGLTAASTITLRKALANTALTTSITAGTTGTFVSASNLTVDLVDADLVNLAIVAGTGGNGTVITIAGTYVAASVPATFITMTPNLLTLTNKFITKI
jgi:hypothetical protein